LTVILAVIFVVLLIVLIALLAKKPAETEELGETSYY
jgi:preprotein translocase subunit SecG